MKRMKQLLSLVICLCLLVGTLIPAYAEYVNPVDDLMADYDIMEQVLICVHQAKNTDNRFFDKTFVDVFCALYQKYTGNYYDDFILSTNGYYCYVGTSLDQLLDDCITIGDEMGKKAEALVEIINILNGEGEDTGNDSASNTDNDETELSGLSINEINEVFSTYFDGENFELKQSEQTPSEYCYTSSALDGGTIEFKAITDENGGVTTFTWEIVFPEDMDISDGEVANKLCGEFSSMILNQDSNPEKDNTNHEYIYLDALYALFAHAHISGTCSKTFGEFMNSNGGFFHSRFCEMVYEGKESSYDNARCLSAEIESTNKVIFTDTVID